jgi:hypothetical protein
MSAGFIPALDRDIGCCAKCAPRLPPSPMNAHQQWHEGEAMVVMRITK